MNAKAPIGSCILLMPSIALMTGGATGEVSELAGGLSGSTQPAIEVSPPEHDMCGEGYLVLFAPTADLPTASTDSGGTHEDPIIRWTIVTGGRGVLE